MIDLKKLFSKDIYCILHTKIAIGYIMENTNKKWEELSTQFENIKNKYNITDIYSFKNESLSNYMLNIQARFDGERLFDTEIEDLEDLEQLISNLDEDLSAL